MPGTRVYEPDPGTNVVPIDSEDVVIGGVTYRRQRIGVARSLTERMFARSPLDGYSLWIDTADVTYIYIAEAPTADAGAALTFQGIRVTKDVSGNPLGKVQIATAFAWDTRGTATWT